MVAGGSIRIFFSLPHFLMWQRLLKVCWSFSEILAGFLAAFLHVLVSIGYWLCRGLSGCVSLAQLGGSTVVAAKLSI